MNFLLVSINAKYIHSNLAVRCLSAYAKKQGIDVSIAEYTINQLRDDILEHIYRQKPDLVAFSCYLWNINFVREIAEEFHKICPNVPIWTGGPEVSYETEAFLRETPFITGVMIGEGERTFSELCKVYNEEEAPNRGQAFHKVDGIAYRSPGGELIIQPPQSVLAMDEIPFCYGDMSIFEHRIIYYESSRGCPFHCSYCLSSVDKTLRFRSLSLVLPELQFFLDHKVPQVKFVDRTFNCKHEHALGIWKYIKEHDNGVTNFHFEVSADLLNEEELKLMSDMRPGLIQLEVGVQSTYEETIHEIHRTMRLSEVKKAVDTVKQGKNIHQHLDLIAGLPFEDYERFQKSFDDIYAWKPDQLQLGFLKVLKGSYMYEHAAEYEILYHTRAPYEVLSTKWISYEELLEIHLVEQMLEAHYNSGQFLKALQVLEQAYDSAFRMFLDMGHFYREKGYLDSNHSRVRRTEIFLEFALAVDKKRENQYKEALLFDLYKIEKSKSRPAWAKETKVDHRDETRYLRKKGLDKKYCHLESFSYLYLDREGIHFNDSKETKWLLFDYEKRDPLTNEAEVTEIQIS